MVNNIFRMKKVEIRNYNHSNIQDHHLRLEQNVTASNDELTQMNKQLL